MHTDCFYPLGYYSLHYTHVVNIFSAPLIPISRRRKNEWKLKIPTILLPTFYFDCISFFEQPRLRLESYRAHIFLKTNRNYTTQGLKSSYIANPTIKVVLESVNEHEILLWWWMFSQKQFLKLDTICMSLGLGWYNVIHISYQHKARHQ